MNRICLILLLACATFGAAAQRPFSRDYWLNDNSSPVKVNALAQDKNGYLWLGTDEGLYRFNGRSFLHIPDSAGRAITALAASGDSIFCGYANGAIRSYADGIFHPLMLQRQGPSSLITALVVRDGCIYACTDEEGIFAIINGRTWQLDKRSGLSDNYVYSLSFWGDRHALVATDHGINEIEMRPDGKMFIRIVDARSGLPDNIVRSVAMTPAMGSAFWAGMQDGGLSRMSFGEDSAHAPAYPDHGKPGLASNWHWGQINDVLAISDDHAWVATEDGYLVDCHITGSGLDAQPLYFPGKRLRKLIRDGTGTIWCATTTGITLITGDYISWLPLAPPYALSAVSAVACDPHNNLYYAQGNEIWECSPLHPGNEKAVFQSSRPITSLHFDARGQLWVGSLGEGLICIRGNSPRSVADVPALRGGQILDIASVPGELWVSSLNGVEQLIFENDSSTTISRIVHHGKHEGIGSDYVYQLVPDSKGNIWMATDGAGICMYDGQSYHHWDSASGFPAKVVYSIAEDAAHQIWAATFGEGLFVYRGGRWQEIGMRQGLQDIALSAVAANASGELVAIHNKGIDEWYPQNGQFRHFNQRLGVDLDSQSNALNCYTNDTAGNVWLPFGHGLICFRNVRSGYDLRPGIVINKVMLFFRPVSKGTTSFQAGENHVSFAFDGINFTNPEPLYYRYKLEGFDSTWVSTVDESVTFPRLPAGQYRFRVQASLSPDFGGAREASYAFRISLPLWKQRWVVSIMLVLIVAAGYLVLRLRERNLRRETALQRERMVAEYEQLKSQVNPHFLFNSLNTLVSLIDEDSHAATQYTIRLSDLYRSILTYKDRDLILLADEWALLQKYIYIQQTRFPDSLNVVANIPDEIASTRQIIPLALQLLMENAIKHNIVAESQPLDIFIDANEETITMRNKLRPKMGKAEGEGLGLSNISRRYSLMTSRSVSYGISKGEFTVTIPLL